MNKEIKVDDKNILEIKCGILAIHLLFCFLFTIVSMYLFYDLCHEIIDIAINKSKDHILGYVKTKLIFIFSLFISVHVIMASSHISFLRKRQKWAELPNKD